MGNSKFEFQLAEACADLELRLRGGERNVLEKIFESQPRLQQDAESAVELIYAEYVVLCEIGEPPVAQLGL